MQKVLNFCKRVLSYKLTAIVFIIIAILIKIGFQFSFFSITGDKANLLVAAKNLLAGHGLTIDSFVPDNLSVEKFTPLIGWPPGYSLMITPFIWFFRGDYISAAIAYDIFCILPFFFFFIKLLDFLLLQRWLRNLLILFTGFFIYPVGSDTSTDLIALSCMIAGFYFLLRFMKEEKRGLSLVYATSLMLFLAGLFRYQYIPVSISSLLFLGFAGYINKKKLWINGSFKIGLLVGLSLFFLLLFQHFYTGSATYLNTREKGFYPENIFKIYPFVPASLIDTQTPITVISNLSGINYFFIGSIVRYCGYFLFIALFTYGGYVLKAKKMILKNKEDYFLYLGSGISICIVSLLLYLSLRNSPNISPFYAPWTYVEEYRYFIFIVIFIQLLVFTFLFNRFSELSAFWRKLAIFCAFLMLSGFLHKTIYISKLLLFAPPGLNVTQTYTKATVPVLKLIKEAQSEFPSYEIMVSSPDNNICNYARLLDVKIVQPVSPSRLTQAVYGSKNIKILISIPAKLLFLYFPMFQNPDLHFYRQLQSDYFYIQDVIPVKQ